MSTVYIESPAAKGASVKRPSVRTVSNYQSASRFTDWAWQSISTLFFFTGNFQLRSKKFCFFFRQQFLFSLFWGECKEKGEERYIAWRVTYVLTKTTTIWIINNWQRHTEVTQLFVCTCVCVKYLTRTQVQKPLIHFKRKQKVSNVTLNVYWIFYLRKFIFFFLSVTSLIIHRLLEFLSISFFIL